MSVLKVTHMGFSEEHDPRGLILIIRVQSVGIRSQFILNTLRFYQISFWLLANSPTFVPPNV